MPTTIKSRQLPSYLSPILVNPREICRYKLKKQSPVNATHDVIGCSRVFVSRTPLVAATSWIKSGFTLCFIALSVWFRVVVICLIGVYYGQKMNSDVTIIADSLFGLTLIRQSCYLLTPNYS
ncbi:hypothetical protein Zmor_002257 [Zophobas morio]|uniref:Uncharacterized protein n=1 Tax=Zophobas morio TaxID=2755281 RepID=A0AA38J0C4_9CUCU|nr:hypothetical protein Zmor_002257 [Zophobas morio]